jgi:heme exporter protein A
MGALASLDVENLSCVRRQRLLFRDLSFRARAGEVLCIEGANGAGKTSLLRLIAGFLAPAVGTIRLRMNGVEISDGEERGKFVGFLGHADAVKPQMTVGETLRFFARLYGRHDDIAPALDAMGLARLRDFPGQYLSAGQKKRLALARLQLSGRPLWLLDEPLAALDAAGKAVAAGLLAAHCAAGGVAIAATHEPLGLACERLVLGSAA